ncbi:hypothetical protein ACXR0O_21545 [Verrucomicrobiota bacterium sgz303538]
MAEARAGYEKRDVSVRGIVWFAIAMVIAAIVMNIGLWLFELGLNRLYPNGPAASRIGRPRVEPPPPRLQSSPTADLQELRAAEDGVLNSYGWINREAGVIRIPIERAMEITNERGLPSRQTQKATP